MDRPVSLPLIIEGSTILSFSYFIITQAPELFQNLKDKFRKKEPAPEPITLTDKTRTLIAYHESGHALVCMLLPETKNHLKKISIIPGEVNDYGEMTLGYTETEPEDKKYTYSKEDMIAILMKALGGTVAEEIVFNTITTGACDDLARVTNMVGHMICDCGMSDKLGKMSYRYNYSQKTAELVDDEARQIVNECYEKAKQLLLDNRDKLDLLANTLLEKGTMDGEQVYKLFEDVETDSVETDSEVTENE